MASYSSRWSEIEKGFEEAYKKAIEKKEPEDVVMAQKIRIAGVLRNYIDFRNKSLDEMTKGLREFSDSFKESSRAEKWKSDAAKYGQEAFKMISDLDDNEESILNVFVLAIATQEANFFNKIGSMKHGAIQGFLCECAKTLREEREKLGGKWSATENSVKSLNEKSKRAAKQVLEVFNKALIEVGKENRRAAELLKNALLLYKKYQDAKTGGEPGIPDLFEDGESRTRSLVDTAEDVSRLYLDAYKSKQTALVLFGNNREAVNGFLNKTNLEVAMDRTEEAQKEAESAAGSMMTSAQQSDAKAFVSEANNAIKGPVENYEKGFNDFVSEYRGIFIGPIGSKELDQLLEERFWQETEDSFKRLNFESELKKYYEQAEDMWNVPVDGLDDDLRIAFKDQFKKMLREYDDEVEKMIMTYRKALELMLKYPFYRLKDVLNRFKFWDD